MASEGTGSEVAPSLPTLAEEMKRLEALADQLEKPLPLVALPRSEYLEATGIVSLLLEGLSWVIQTKPEDPVENLAMFLIKNNPKHPERFTVIDLSEVE